MDDNIRMMTVMICRIWHGRLNAMRGTTKSTVGTANDQLISISGNNIVRYTREVADDILIKVSLSLYCTCRYIIDISTIIPNDSARP
mmetsp:Transcript_22288/g.21971  ORF Transcript_22288/g.21971 Transcript_22288/m.21971 type:complete len:87 (+) Transcript_22288:88-348(+)